MILQSPRDERPAPVFSLVAGGPFYGLRLRLGLLSPPLENLWRLTLALMALAWVPPFVFAAAHGAAAAFLRDAEVQVRFLLCLPILIHAEGLVHRRLSPLPDQFLARGLIAPGEGPAFEAAIAGALRLRDGPAELILLGLIYALRASPWDLTLTASGQGWYYLWVSLPLYQFLLARWFWRLVIWARLLWRLARLRLSLLPAHPDKAGGLGFLSVAVVAFEPLLFSQSALLAAYLAGTARAPAPWIHDKDVVAIFLGGILVILGPLAFFAPALAAARRRAWRDYGELFSRCLRDFEKRWLAGEREGEALPASGDLQGQASIDGSYQPLDRMRPVPFGLESVVRLGVWAALPWLPAALAAGRALEVLKLLLKVLW